MKCRHCGKDIPEGQLFCPECGKPAVQKRGADAEKRRDTSEYTAKQRNKRLIAWFGFILAALVLIAGIGYLAYTLFSIPGQKETVLTIPGKGRSDAGAELRLQEQDDIQNVTETAETAETEIDADIAFLRSQDADSWVFQLVNEDNPIAPDFEPQGLIPLKNGQQVERRCYYDLKDMMSACRLDGLDPKICKSYVTAEEQQKLYTDTLERYIADGLEESLAEKRVSAEVEKPNCTEHRTALAVDILSESNESRDHTQDESKVQKWLLENAWTYGFIQRYPEDKAEITGVHYEPWHYRYVGIDLAAYMHENNLCFEEMLALVQNANAE